LKALDDYKTTPCTRLAAALHAACVELEAVRQETAKVRHENGNDEPASGADWYDKIGRHVALAIAAMPDSVLRAWLMDPRVVGGEEIYRTLKTGAGTRASGKAAAA